MGGTVTITPDAEPASPISSAPVSIAPDPDGDTGIWAGVKRNTVGAVTGIYHALTAPATDDEKQELLDKVRSDNKRYGDEIPESLATDPSQATLAYHRLIDAPASELMEKGNDEVKASKDLLSNGKAWKAANMYASGLTDEALSALPLVGPWINSVAVRAEKGDVSGAGTDLASAAILQNAKPLLRGTGEAISGTREAIGGAIRDSEGDLKPHAKTVGQLAGAGGGGLLGHVLGSPEVGAIAGYKGGPTMMESLFPEPKSAVEARAQAEAYQAKAEDLIRRGKEQDVLDRKAATAAKAAAKNAPAPPEPSPFGNATSTAATPAVSAKSPAANAYSQLPAVPKGNPTPFPDVVKSGGTGDDLINRMKRIAVPGQEPDVEDLKRAGDFTQAPIAKLKTLAKFGDKLAQNEINRRLKNQ